MKNSKPYYAVIFTSTQTETIEGYSEMAVKMENLAKQQKGFIGIDSARNEVGITVSYWESLEAIKNWKANTDHLFAQQKGREQWYNWYNVKICKVEREYEFMKDL
ncbi:antibiotic biosynthesis monooxygenase [Winogradskyella echinorum]|uniref:Antibiotic biosynthesis monooxygenase n=1 Tax=Winogradskyella echinorum TaxID=538189 RepID=A0ABR6XZN2_9FLAO|nr:antibiotic biosynthesis monooxygenase [Winogradskyella echinorum]MBC3845925.1 antibiotic biosynthesis monooxygenase [Winogradskyella echinorum]MBC5750273.1 antibiotic biosynthesis monooxygenase [Winogradskyella echinorum]